MKDPVQNSLSLTDHQYLQRCLLLAQMGSAKVFPNPQVGAVLVHKEKIIGEGYHAYAGGPHAEVRAIESVKDKELLKKSSMYVSLEPCSHHGKTPPCVSAIMHYQIPRVVIGCLDPNPQVSGRGIQRLRESGIEVMLAADPSPFQRLNQAFFTNQQKKRPRIILKWAESGDGFIAGLNQQQEPYPTPITGREANIWVHKLRSHVQTIMIGRKTAMIDNPNLTTRHFYGENPRRIILDRHGRLPNSLRIFRDEHPSILLTQRQGNSNEVLQYYSPSQWQDLKSLMEELYAELGICSILIEGGAQLLQQFLDQGIWDEIWRFQSPKRLGDGLPAPSPPPDFAWGSPILVGKDLLYCIK